jgi:hypothetical protein
MSKPSRRPATRPAGEPAGKPEKTRDLLSRWWVQLLVAAWILAVVTIYFRLQLLRLLEIAMRRP